MLGHGRTCKLCPAEELEFYPEDDGEQVKEFPRGESAPGGEGRAITRRPSQPFRRNCDSLKKQVMA